MTSVITDLGKKVLINRGYKSTPDYTIPSQFKIGQSQATPTTADTDLTQAVPIDDGTVNDDGSNTLTGSDGGDNSTDNTTTFKQGAGVSDDTAQNLIANDTNATKTWTIADLSSAGTLFTQTLPFGLWLYIKDATALAKLKSSGTAIEIKLGSDSSNYFSKTFEDGDVAVGWNWLTSGTTAVEDLNETGTVAGNVDTFIIEITTNNATDEFAAGDVVYDLLRSWEEADLVQNLETGYPSINESTFKVTMRGVLTSVKGNGFNLNGAGVLNTDATNKLTDADDYDADGKTDTDEFVYQWVNQIV